MASVTNLEQTPTNNLCLYKRNALMISLSTAFFSIPLNETASYTVPTADYTPRSNDSGGIRNEELPWKFYSKEQIFNCRVSTCSLLSLSSFRTLKAKLSISMS